MLRCRVLSFFFFFNDTATTEIYTLSLHDALPICLAANRVIELRGASMLAHDFAPGGRIKTHHKDRSEEHTSELQSQSNLVCRLLLEKKKQTTHIHFTPTSYSPYPFNRCVVIYVDA